MTTIVTPKKEPTTNGSTSFIPIPANWLGPVRGIWGIVVMYCFTLFFAGIPTRYQYLVEVPPEKIDALNQLGLTPEIQAYWLLAVEIIFMLGFSIVGILIYFQKSNDLVTVSTSLLLVSFGTTNLNIITSLAMFYPAMEIPTRIAKFISWSLLIPILYTFPNGKFIPSGTRWLALIWIGTNLAWLIYPDLPNNPTQSGMLTQPFWFYFYLAWFLSSVIAQVFRFKRSKSLTQKQQTKWAVFGFCIAVAGTFLEELPAMINPGLMNSNTPEGVLYTSVSVTFFLLFMLFVPITLGISIRRNRLWDIDFVINRSLVYGLASGLLALVFTGIFFLLQYLFERLTGVQQSALAVVASTLTITGLFTPVRSRMQTFIDRQLYGIHINYKRRPFVGLSKDYRYFPEPHELDKYLVLEPIGRGGMAEIYKGRRKADNLEVAIKVLSPKNPDDESSFRLRFAREAETAFSLKHPNIVKVYEHCESDELCYIVMEYISGLNLLELIRESGLLEIEAVQALVLDISKALDYAHKKGIIHRDIKPSNVLLRPVHRLGEIIHEPVLTDFGIAKMVAAINQITVTEIVGTLDYIAPEQIQASSHVDHKADIYALGIMTFQMLTGRLPFPNHNPSATLIGHLQHPPPNPQNFHPFIPDHIAQAIKKALAKEPNKRFASASEFAEAIQ